MIRICILWLLSCLVCISCEERESGAVFCHSYVSVYVLPEEIVLYEDDDLLRIDVKGETVVDGEEGFEELARHYNDVSYGRWVVDGPCRAVFGTITSIEIECDREFCGYPGYSSLNDLVVFHTYTPYNYVRSGYVDNPDTDVETWASSFVKPEFSSVSVPCSSLAQGNVQMFAPNAIALSFLENPDSGVYRITVKLGIDNVEYAATLRIDFGE